VVRRALAGVRRTRNTPPKRRRPLLLADVRLLLAELAPSFYVWPAAMAAHRDAALLLMGFTGAHRRSELVNLVGTRTFLARRMGPLLLPRPRITTLMNHASWPAGIITLVIAQLTLPLPLGRS